MNIFFEKSLIYSVIAVYLFITVAPLVWVLSTSFKPNQEAISFPPKFLPDHPTFENYFFVLTDSKLVLSLINSLIVSVGSTALSVTVSALGGYAFARYDFKGKNLLMSTILALFMIPVVINIIPLYIMLANVGLLNSLVALVLTFQILIIPLNIFLLKNYFESLPKELEEAALIDGCSKLGALIRVTIPMSLPGFIIAAILSFRFSWNEGMHIYKHSLYTAILLTLY
jgi:multiple sugar transport system permease protein